MNKNKVISKLSNLRGILPLSKMNKTYKPIIVVFSFMFLSIIFSSTIIESTKFRSTTYFPDEEWRRAPLEDFGLDAVRLDQMNVTITTLDIGMDSFHIIRHGYLVYEQYFDYYNHSNLHHMQSVTKSVMSLLIGIAQAEGFISTLDELILDIFSDRTFLNVDSRKEALTIRHLLQMRSGLEWNSQDVPFMLDIIDSHDYELLTNISNWWDLFPSNPIIDWNLMIHSPDWVQFVLDKPMVADPGTEFYYNSGCSHLLSAIIANKTGMNTERFAKEYLFDPLGITEYAWQNDTQNISMGGFGLWLQPTDMAKIGYLCLNNGIWNGEEIIPQAWIQDSSQDYSTPLPETGYGYQWWIYSDHDPPYYRASGFGGQFIAVIPDADIIIVMTSSEYGNSYSDSMFNSYILQAIDWDFTYTESTTEESSTTTPVSTEESSTTTTVSIDDSTTPQTTSITSLTVVLGCLVLFLKKKKTNKS